MGLLFKEVIRNWFLDYFLCSNANTMRNKGAACKETFSPWFIAAREKEKEKLQLFTVCQRDAFVSMRGLQSV